MIDTSCLIHLRFIKCAATAFIILIVLGIAFLPGYVYAQETGEQSYSIGIRGGSLFKVDDIPVKNLSMVECYVRRSLDNSWYALLSLDSFVFEAEGLNKMLGLPVEDDTEAFGKMSLLTASLEYVFCRSIKSFPVQPYARTGVGIGFSDFDIDNDDTVTGNGNSDIDIDTDNNVEVVPTVSAGIRYAFKSRWFLDAGTRFDYHICHWTVTDRTSNRKEYINHFTAIGAYAGVEKARPHRW